MEKSKFTRALESASDIFRKGIDQLRALEDKVHIARAKAINFAIDAGKAEGLKPTQIVDAIDVEVFAPAEISGGIGGSTRANYRSGLRKALAHGVAWCATSHKDLEAVAEPGKKAKGRPKAKTTSARKASKTVAVKLDAKAKTVTLTVPSWTKPDAVAEPMLAVLSEAGRFALFQAWMKSHGWIEA
jgi:hypothetical protein